MSSATVKKIGDLTLKSICESLTRRTSIAGKGLYASDGCVNMDRITKYFEYKCHKDFARRKYAMKLNDYESVKELAWSTFLTITKDEARKIATETMLMNSLPLAMEEISDVSLKSSKILNWLGVERKNWGNIADLEFKPACFKDKCKKDFTMYFDGDARESYVKEVFEVPHTDFCWLGHYAEGIFTVRHPDGLAMASQVIAIERIIETALKASQTLYLYARGEQPTEPIDGEYHKEKISFAEDEYLKDCQTKYVMNAEPVLSDTVTDCWTRPWKAGFMESRDTMSIFMDSYEAREEYRRKMILWWSTSSCTLNWARMTRFMEFKARKEYAMETFGVKLGDFHSLKKIALKLFDITEGEAENLASKTMAMDSESIGFEKIADAAFKASKILNWTDGNNDHEKPWNGNIGDAAGFKSFKSLSNYCKGMSVEARKAYTMEAFGVDSVDIDYLKNFAINIFNESTEQLLDEHEAVIMACQTVAIDAIVDALSKNLNLTLPLVEPKEVEEVRARAHPQKPSQFCCFSVPESIDI
ncbi:hypothetical protein OROGR_008584 [Orobanche gracilis]